MNFDELLKEAQEKDKQGKNMNFDELLKEAQEKDKQGKAKAKVTLGSVGTKKTLPIPLASPSKAGEERAESALIRSQKTPTQLEAERVEALKEIKVYPKLPIAGAARGILGVAKAVPAVASASLAEGTQSKRAEEANRFIPINPSSSNLKSAEKLAQFSRDLSYPGTAIDEFISGTEKELGELQSPGGRFLGNLLMQAGQMAPSIATGGLAGAGAGLATLGAGVYGQSFGEAVERGSDVKTAGQYAALSSALELATETLVGGIPGLGKGLLSKIIQTPSAVNLASRIGVKSASNVFAKTASAVGKTLSSKGGRLLVNAFGEGIEEVIAEYLAPSIERSTIDPNAPDATIAELAESFAVGGLLSAVLGVPSITLSTGKTVTKLDDVDTLTATETKEFEDELYRLARESNIRKGKITPDGEPIEAYSAEEFANMYGLPTPAPKRFNPKTIPLYSGGGLIGNEAYTRAKTIYDSTIKELTEYIKNYKPKGTITHYVDAYGNVVDPTREVVNAGARRVTVSQNDEWYRDFWRENSRKPNKGEAKEIAKNIVDDTLKYEKDDGFVYNPELIDLIKSIYPNAEGSALDILNRAESDSRTFQRGEPAFFGDVEPVKPLRRIKTKEPIPQRIIERPFTVTPAELATTQTIPQQTLTSQPTFEAVNRPVQARTVESGTLLSPQQESADLRTLVAGVAPQIKDISVRSGRRNDIWEVFRMAFGKSGAALKKAVLDPFAKDKGNAARYQIEKANTLKTEMKRLGIKKGSRESIAVREFGEGMRIIKRKVANLETGKQQEQYMEEPYTLQDLQKEFPSNWQNIVEADKWFRKEYDEFIDRINAVKSIIYPNADANFAEYEARIQRVQNGEGKYANYSAQEKSDAIKRLRSEQDRYITGKRIPKREDYYRHFTELTKGFAGLWNIIDSPAQIGSHLQGISEFTKPKSKWESFAQHRKGDYTEADAISGYLNYMPGAAYAIYIDPHIAKFRELADALADATEQTNNAGNLILTLRDYADSLAGKTSTMDRALLKTIPGGRKGLRALNWLNNRVKANVILFNMGATVSQLANIPAGIATIKNPTSLARGMYHTLAKNPAIKMSDYMTERLMGDVTDQFNESLLHKPMEFAKWLISAGDAVGSRFIWYSAYENALAKGSENPVLEADDMTRMLTAGRGIGEVPLNQRDSITKLVAPFTIEVQNMWRIQKRFVSEKDFGGLLLFWVLSFLFNEGMEEIRGTRILFDPIDAMRDALTEEDLSPLERGGRLAGEYLSNVPFGQTFAALYPEYGLQPIEGVKLPTREKLFGDTDPTRFGTGILAQQAITDPIFKILPPAGGAQIKKTYDFLKSAQVLPVVNPLSENFGKRQDIKATQKNGKIKFGLGDSAETMIKGSLFGSYATEEGKEYIESNQTPIGEKNSAIVTSLAKAGVDDVEAVNLARQLPNLKVDAARETIMNSNLSAKQKNIAGALVNSTVKVDYTNKGTYEFSLLPKETRRKYLTVSGYGISKEDFIYVMDNKDADRNGGVTKDEAIKVLDSMNFTRKQKAIMWPLVSTAKNPYQ